MKKWLVSLSGLLVLGFVLAACGPVLETDAPQTDTVSVPMPGDKTATQNVTISPGVADVNLTPGGSNLVQATVEYNVTRLKPVISNSANSVAVKQEASIGILPGGATSKWQMTLGQGVPLNLNIETGASKGKWELGGLSLRSLNWKQGAADSELSFSQPNPLAIDNFDFVGGASSLTVRGLANANIRNGKFTLGAGSLHLYFDGKLTQDTTLRLEGGASSITIYSGGNPVQLITDGSALLNINRGNWSKTDNAYQSPEWNQGNGSKIKIDTGLGVASLTLK